MRYVEGGPDIPLEVLQAHEAGRLVPFCGAGVSRRAGLPDFRELTDRVCRALGGSRDEDEEREWRAENYDRVLYQLERRVGRDRVRRAVADELATPSAPKLNTHRAILDLATDKNGDLRVVTTNFDRLFEEARTDLPVTSAPLLPVPKPRKWNRLVHLHGCIQSPDDPQGQHLVLSSSDFGTAYLVEGWASRFVVDLFSECVVIFIGYGINDPVMRYLADAIAAERAGGTQFQQSYAMVERSTIESENRRWLAMGIEPIFYDSVDKHRVLHETLECWAASWREGLEGKINAVSSLASIDPQQLPKEQIDMFCWAVGDPSGAMARHLASLGSTCLGWLTRLDDAGLLRMDIDQDGIGCAMVDAGETTVRPGGTDAVRRGLAEWMVRHLDDQDLLRWVIQRGSSLHPELITRVRRRLRQDGCSDRRLASLWHALTGGVPLMFASNRDQTYRRIATADWSTDLRMDFLGALEPRVANLRAWSYPEVPDADARSIGIAFDCEVVAGHTCSDLAAQVLARADWPSIATDVVFDLTARLRQALDIHAALGLADNESDPSHIQRPSIADHEQNHDFHGWTTLIRLVRAAFDACDQGMASAVSSAWHRAPYPIFRRLVLYGLRKRGIPAPSAVMTDFTEDPWNWLWSTDVQVELFSALPAIWKGLSRGERRQFIRILIQGPPRVAFQDSLPDSDWEYIRDHQRWERLVRLRELGFELEADAKSCLAGIEAAHPDWILTGEAHEGFPVWTSSVREGRGRAPTAVELEGMDVGSLAEELLESRDTHSFFYEWRQFVERHSLRAIGAYERLATARPEDPEWWSTLSAFQGADLDSSCRARLLRVLEAIPIEASSGRPSLRGVSEAVARLCESLPGDERARVLSLWTAITAAVVRANDVEVQADRMFSAINHASGLLTRAVMRVTREGATESTSEIPEDVRGCLGLLAGADGGAAGLGRVVLAANLAFLHDLDADWTREHLLPRFDWSDVDESAGAWQGFLHSPWLGPSLWRDLHGPFLATFEHLEHLQDGNRRNLAWLLASLCARGDDALSSADARRCISLLPAVGREDVCKWLVRKLRDAGAKANSLWHERVQPWLTNAWPLDNDLRSPGVSTELALAAVLAGEAAQEAMDCVTPMLSAGEYLGTLIDELLERRISIDSPGSVLAMLNVLLGDATADPGYRLQDVLDEIARGDEELSNTPSYRRLKEIALGGR